MKKFEEIIIRKLKINPELYVGKIVKITGWIKNNRVGGKISFLTVNDGSGLENLQIIYRACNNNQYDYNDLQKWPIGSAVKLIGTLIAAKNASEKIELALEKITLINSTNADYFLQKKEHSLEFLREHSELRGRSQYYLAIFRIRNELIKTIHDFFQNNDFHYLQTPIITNNDCEGGGEAFIIHDENSNNLFFKKKALLSVSGQLHAEGMAQCLKKVYTFGPTFRADKSNTRFHASEFWMLEPEIAFANMQEGMAIVTDLIKTVAEKIKNKMQTEINYLSKKNVVDLDIRFKKIVNNPFKELTYHEAIEILYKNKAKFEIQDIKWGMNLLKEHEKFICERIGTAVFITDYPNKIKAFYMKQNPDDKTVACFDLLIPEIGELVGGSERENDFQKLKNKIVQKKLSSKEIEWYINLRKQGYGGSTGFGLGFDRLLMFLTGVKNIRDVIPYYNGFGNLKY